MALNVTAKAASNVSNTPSKVITRQEVSMGRQTASSARAEALKSRLSGQPVTQPAVPRPARTSGRAEEMAKLQKFNSPVPPPQRQPATSARTPQRMDDIAPPPSGLANVQPTKATEATPHTEAPSEEALSPQFAALAQKERQLWKARQEFKATQDAWKQEQAKYLSREAFASDPLKALAEAGITADKLVELQINQSVPKDPQQVLLDKIAQLEAKLNGLTDPENGEFAKRDQQAYDQAVAQIGSDAKLLVDSNPAFGTIKSEGKTKDVVDLITSVFDDEGTILDVEEACQLIEDKLTENLIKDYERLSKYEKIQNKLRKQAEPEEASPVQQPPSQQSRLTTLTNAGSATKPLTPRDRAILLVQERIDAIKGR